MKKISLHVELLNARAKELVESGFEFVTAMDGAKIFSKTQIAKKFNH